MIISIALPDLGIGKSRLSADVSASATSSTVENNSDFGANDYVLFGKPGNEETEIVLLTSVTGNTTIGHTTGPVFDHPARTPILEIKYNQAKIYRATTEAGEYSLIATTDLTPDEQYTEYDDTAGTSTSWYKIKYYNETTEALSDYSPAVQGTGYTDDALRSMADEVLEEFGDKNENEVSRDLVKNKLKSGVRRIVREIIKNYPEYFLSYTTQALTADTPLTMMPIKPSLSLSQRVYQMMNIKQMTPECFSGVAHLVCDLLPIIVVDRLGCGIGLILMKWMMIVMNMAFLMGPEICWLNMPYLSCGYQRIEKSRECIGVPFLVS